MQNWKDLYQELSEKLNTIEEVRWIDLWNSQVYNLENEHPFPAPAIFLAFRGGATKDMGQKVQEVALQVDVFIFWETFLDTFKGAYNQADALKFLDTITAVNKILHGSSGEHYSSMRRVSFSPVDTMGAGNLFNVTYSCVLIDYSAQEEFEEGNFEDVNVNKFIIPLDD